MTRDSRYCYVIIVVFFQRLRILRHEVNEVIARKRSQETPYHEPQRIVLQALDFLTTLEKGGKRREVLACILLLCFSARDKTHMEAD